MAIIDPTPEQFMTQFVTMVACYGGGSDDMWPQPFDPFPVVPAPTNDRITIPAALPITEWAIIPTPPEIRDLTDAERRGLAKLLPLIEAALGAGTKLDRDQIAGYVLLGKLAETA